MPRVKRLTPPHPSKRYSVAAQTNVEREVMPTSSPSVTGTTTPADYWLKFQFSGRGADRGRGVGIISMPSGSAAAPSIARPPCIRSEIHRDLDGGENLRFCNPAAD